VILATPVLLCRFTRRWSLRMVLTGTHAELDLASGSLIGCCGVCNGMDAPIPLLKLRTHSRPEALLPLGRAEWTTRLRRRPTRFFDACPLFSRNSCTSHLVEQGAKGKGAQSPSCTTYFTDHGRYADLDGAPIAGLRTDPGIRSSSVNNDNGPLRPYSHGCAS
jgi:hypothetical protein